MRLCVCVRACVRACVCVRVRVLCVDFCVCTFRGNRRQPLYSFHFAPVVWLHTEILILLLILRQYNCTEMYIVKYRQSIAFLNIYIGGGHFS